MRDSVRASALPKDLSIELPADDARLDGDVDESPLRDPRNENSLAFLCQRFCDLYRDHPEPINIDLAAKELGIQRRRMYEILNIIQSVGLVARLRASFYRWEGTGKMTATLERLKEDGMARQPKTASAGKKPEGASPDGQRKKAVATALGERFVQIFLCNEVPQPVILEDIMGLFSSCVAGAPTNQMSCARRLYDIANVFCSIGLVQKSCSAATDHRRKKRLYIWTGPVLPATTTPLRPHRQLSAPSASPDDSSAKRVKREASADSVKSKPSKKGKYNLEDSIIKAEAAAEDESSTHGVVLQHPAVAALKGRALLSRRLMPPSMGPTTNKHSNAALQLHSLSVGDKSAAGSTSSAFNPTNAKDSALDFLPMRRSTTSGITTAKETISTQTSESTTQNKCESEPATESVAELKARIQELTMALEEANEREQGLLKRIDAQEVQIQTLMESTAKAQDRQLAKLINSSSPLSNFVFSPYRGPNGATRDLLSPSPSPFNPFSTGLTGSSHRRPPMGRKARIGPHIVDPTTADEDPKSGSSSLPHLSPLTTSIASSLLLSPATLGDKDKENRVGPILGSPSTTRRSSATSSAPGTPPSHLIATAACSLLSLTPTQIPSLSPSLGLFSSLPPSSDDEPSTMDPAKDSDSSSDAKRVDLVSMASIPESSLAKRRQTEDSSLSSSSLRRTRVMLLESPASIKNTFDTLSPPVPDCLT
ncbi:hypothetical protein Poli38472_004527 [Pythium oligandrum]|uniref:E2F/DP family winged-helix DNA-binding domain-containing protein n=1 Tax=Pythium oligandrum TaxID=41045 RepID=A0A8K1FI76_PYTOL|nr:hypothetical protein Poli38472_004527 [Pythium oligandrum]|eukprot:TMW59458.1 hypothetical protein Poli38472_004527 [Pythium oligandrum]